MGRIRVLSDHVANKIAAGEVVERPASVVKELLENSLDAGSTSIRVEIENGGRRLIRIADDGCGMLRDDALLAFERHATSKLHDVKDLLSIGTLGFRGEALPSVASVSRLLLETRSLDEQTGTRVEIAGGKILSCDEIARGGGTTIAVRDLFFNVPARKKFLRSEQTELAHIASLVTHYSLAHPDKTFELWNGGANLLHATPVETLRERVFQVFGSQLLEDLIELEPISRTLPMPEPDEPPRTYSVCGFVSRPQVQKNNRNSIFVFVNGRLIRDRLVLHALSSAYHNLMPPACFPFALLFLDCDCEEVDVNVHPSKTEVRFRHQSWVHDFVRDAVREQLMLSRPAPSFTPGVNPIQPGGAYQPGGALPYSDFSQVLQNETAGAGLPATVPEYTLLPPQPPPARFDFGDTAIPLSEPKPEGERQSEQPLRLRVPDTHGGFPDGTVHAAPDMTRIGELRPLGQLHSSFIIAAGTDGLWIIDQHVAHERILFEQVLKQQAAGRPEVQHLLMPVILQLTPEQQIEYARIADELHNAGFETEPFGNRTIAVKAAPAAVGQGDLERVILEILEIAENELRSVSVSDLRRGIAASIACRAAIKINTPLDQRKMEWMLRTLAATDYPMACPHGRPVALQYSTRDILKSFHRI
ncbi:MAG TPA: DNA mismatch repair endonuclease MutL [Bryobacteraceae bacterium]|nr:DNA mismatch repair endonuclease MutL [Bryobacteraceae bacterium]